MLFIRALESYFDCFVSYLYNVVSCGQCIFACLACRYLFSGKCVDCNFCIFSYDYLAVSNCYLNLLCYWSNCCEVLVVCDDVAEVFPLLLCLVCFDCSFAGYNECCCCEVGAVKNFGSEFCGCLAFADYTYYRTVLECVTAEFCYACRDWKRS